MMIISTTSLIAMQAVAGDWFPPEVSISQYGVGAYGWTLTSTLLFFACAAGLILWSAHRLGAATGWLGILPWSLWILSLTVMAFVPTNEWPAPLSLGGQIHQAAAVCGLFSAPIGAVLMARGGQSGPRLTSGGRRPRAQTLVVVSALSSWFFLALLLLTNIDIDVTGLGYRRAWSLHQTLAVVADIVMTFALIICLRVQADHDAPVAPGRSAPPSAPPPPSSVPG